MFPIMRSKTRYRMEWTDRSCFCGTKFIQAGGHRRQPETMSFPIVPGRNCSVSFQPIAPSSESTTTSVNGAVKQRVTHQGQIFGFTIVTSVDQLKTPVQTTDLSRIRQTESFITLFALNTGCATKPQTSDPRHVPVPGADLVLIYKRFLLDGCNNIVFVIIHSPE